MIFEFYMYVLNLLSISCAFTINHQDVSKLNLTRRILRGTEAGETRPYMVYLRPATTADQPPNDPNWLCGGAIIHPQYILTSAACIENVERFYVISGTTKWYPVGTSDECIKNGGKKAVWKCVPKDYEFDGYQYDNIRWMINDIAVVKVEDEFNFEKRIRGCDFIPQMVSYNNHSKDLEASGRVASTAGWGTTEAFSDDGKPKMNAFDDTKQSETYMGKENSPTILETDVVILSKKNCKKRWPERYHYVIDQSMICGKDGIDTDAMSRDCRENEIRCKELVYSDEESDEKEADTRRYIVEPELLELHSSSHFNSARRYKQASGGFCENDHGGPLVVGHGSGTIIIGVVSACMTANITKRCHGPFLYTSVWTNRFMISCAIEKEKGSTCRRLLRSNKTIKKDFNWTDPYSGSLRSKSESSSANLRSIVLEDTQYLNFSKYLSRKAITSQPVTFTNITDAKF